MFETNWQDFFASLLCDCSYRRFLDLHGQTFLLASNISASVESISAFFPSSEQWSCVSSPFTLLHLEDEHLYRQLQSVSASPLWNDEPYVGEHVQASTIAGAMLYKRLPTETGYIVLRPIGERKVLIVTTKQTLKIYMF